MKKKTNQTFSIVFLDFDDIRNPLLGAGQAKATLEVGKRLTEKGHKMKVLCSRYPGCKDRTENGIEYKHIGLGTNNIRLNNISYILALPFSVRRIKNADIIVECFTAPISTLFSPLFTKIPVVGLSTSFEADRFSRLYHLPFNLVEKLGLKYYKYFIALSDYFEEKIRKNNPKIISTVIPEGVGEEFFQIKKTKPKYILSLGRYDMDQKGLDLLIKAYGKIADKIQYPLVLVGKGPDKQKIFNLIKQLRLEKKVLLLGPAYGKEKEKYLSESLLVALPSRNETFSCFALEALASGLPLVMFDIPGLRWTNNGVAVKARAFNIDEYAKCLFSSANEAKMTAMGKTAREFASHFTWNLVAGKFENFFISVLEKEKTNNAK
jgi:glycogen synthase